MIFKVYSLLSAVENFMLQVSKHLPLLSFGWGRGGQEWRGIHSARLGFSEGAHISFSVSFLIL